MIGSPAGVEVRPGALPERLDILLLEDNALDAELTCATLALDDLDCRFRRVEDRESFEKALEQHCFDLILADYSLPSFDGISALEIARATCPDTPFIFVSGALGEELAIETLKRGATDYVLKHRLERLRPSVLRALQEKEERRQRQLAELRLRELAAENARLYEEARKANLAKDEFIAMVSHELRTPMTSIVGWARMLKMGGLTEEETQAALDAVERSAAVQARLVDDLLDMSRISTGKLNLELEKIELSEVVTAAVDALRIPAAEKSIAIGLDIRDAPLFVHGDRNRLQQVVSNLLHNAVKFTPGNGAVDVSLVREETGAAIYVRDTGRGIRPELLAKIFEPFQQDENSGGEPRSGLGLGLSIVRHIVTRHGGSIHAESDGVGRGATFRIKLPLLLGVSGGPVRSTSMAMPDLSECRILLVEDDEGARSLMATVLQRCGASVVPVRSVADAIDALPLRTWDVIVSDIAMPVSDGYALMRHVQESMVSPPPVAAVTAFGSAEDVLRIRRAGFQRHMVKPIDPLVFAHTIASMVGRSSRGNAGAHTSM